ncbi:MAG: Crp/Fnr family transcriptional regulator [Bacteroidetes bacterium]|nr:Crp/Fnr family transcriptional regulator [Bacteroidota bacterium]
MSMAVSLRNEPSKINAIAEEESQILLVPVQRALEWINEYPEMTMTFFYQFYHRYSDLVDTIQQIVFNNLEGRLLDYLKEFTQKHHTTVVTLKHREIAADLGTAREVVSRIIKKLEKSGNVRQTKEGIEIFNCGDICHHGFLIPVLILSCN